MCRFHIRAQMNVFILEWEVRLNENKAAMMRGIKEEPRLQQIKLFTYDIMNKEAIKIIYWLMSCILAEHMGSMWSCENSADFCIRFLFKYTRRSRNCFHVTQISNEQEPGNVTVNGFYITLYDLCRSNCSNTLRGCVILFLSDVPSLPACPLFTPPHIKLLHMLVIRKWPE